MQHGWPHVACKLSPVNCREGQTKKAALLFRKAKQNWHQNYASKMQNNVSFAIFCFRASWPQKKKRNLFGWKLAIGLHFCATCQQDHPNDKKKKMWVKKITEDKPLEGKHNVQDQTKQGHHRSRCKDHWCDVRCMAQNGRPRPQGPWAKGSTINRIVWRWSLPTSAIKAIRMRNSHYHGATQKRLFLPN